MYLMFDGIVICLFQAQKEELNLEEKVERAKEKIRQLESTPGNPQLARS